MDRSGKFAGENPFEIAKDWMDQAKELELNDANAIALATVDDAKRGALLAKATEIAIGENTGIIPLHYQVNTWATRKGLKYKPRADERTIGHNYTTTK